MGGDTSIRQEKIGDSEMKKIKRNEVIEKGIILAAILPQVDGRIAGEVMDEAVEAYKGSECIKIFTAEETDAIMQALQSMPGYTPEKLITAGAAVKGEKNSSYETLEWQLFFVYIMLSITNPELFEEEKNGKDDTRH